MRPVFLWRRSSCRFCLFMLLSSGVYQGAGRRKETVLSRVGAMMSRQDERVELYRSMKSAVFAEARGGGSRGSSSELSSELCWGVGGEFAEGNGPWFGWAGLRDVNVEGDCEVVRDVKVMAGDVGDGYVG